MFEWLCIKRTLELWMVFHHADTEHADLEFCFTREDRRLLAHRCIISARCPQLSQLISKALSKQDGSDQSQPEKPDLRKRGRSKEKYKDRRRKKSSSGTVGFRADQIGTLQRTSSSCSSEVQVSVLVKNVETTTFQRILEFLYTGHPGDLVSVDQALPLMELAHAYRLQRLVSMCSWVMQDKVEPRNVVPLLSISDQCHATDLKQRCMSFLVKNMHEVGAELRQRRLSATLMKEIKMELSRHNADKATGML